LKETSLEEHDIIQALKTSTNPAFEINIAGHYVALTLNKTDKTVVLADSAREPQDYSEQTKRIKTIFFE
jgi:predicted peptidase